MCGPGSPGADGARGGSPDTSNEGPSASGGVSPGGGNTGGRAGPTGNEATGPGDVGGAAPGGGGGGPSAAGGVSPGGGNTGGRAGPTGGPSGPSGGVGTGQGMGSTGTPGQAPSPSVGQAVGDAVTGAVSGIGSTVGGMVGAFGDDEAEGFEGVASSVGDENMSSQGAIASASAANQDVSEAMAERAAVSAGSTDVSEAVDAVTEGLSPEQASALTSAGTLGKTPSGLGEGTMGEEGVGSAISDVASAVVPGLNIETTQSPISPRSVTRAQVQPLSLAGTVTGVPTGVPGYGNIDDALGTNIDMGTNVTGTGMSEDEASELGLSANRGGGQQGRGADAGGDGAFREAGGAVTAARNASGTGPVEGGVSAFRPGNYNPYGGDFSTYAQPGGTPSHSFYPDVTAGVRNAWDSAMKGNA